MAHAGARNHEKDILRNIRGVIGDSLQVMSDENYIEAGRRGDIAGIYSADEAMVNRVFQIVHFRDIVDPDIEAPRNPLQVDGAQAVAWRIHRSGFPNG